MSIGGIYCWVKVKKLIDIGGKCVGKCRRNRCVEVEENYRQKKLQGKGERNVWV